jgi:hypothetical protein
MFFVSSFTVLAQTAKMQIELIEKSGDTIRVKKDQLIGFPLKSEQLWIRIYSEENGKRTEYKVIAFDAMIIFNGGQNQQMGSYKNRFIEGEVYEEMKRAVSGDKIQIDNIQVRTPTGKLIDGGSFALTIK